MELLGIDSSADHIFINIGMDSCDQATLAEDQACLSDSELEDYFKAKSLVMLYFDTKIDFEDIENPLKSAMKFESVNLNVQNPKANLIYLKNHEFKDDMKLV